MKRQQGSNGLQGALGGLGRPEVPLEILLKPGEVLMRPSEVLLTEEVLERF